ncbi:bifunctional [glutamine synthetase] adenylyltransferase/[glutamine synthetase]-adenylyl-L-tyrosine phosphorylase [Kineococcus radiotolerans]|uniref:Bifunctional glutamine synthetase adenylyltransferase/adenylyl-removing enzyme n=1 Tax=Kineococcus radiotolerans (strain ATCC BAA-149 / DSM 14245 / SRS30216) TaxID=266940 RepID=A6WD70_KINRD|nr:bifunctional [glutamine synthetase] adenylyltransferase/[glutamine synthetase]-adenylyl-L-tyrosine phosphorylase [Kineococcus radiotolerans]ABS04759.1 (Glutamate--ammonia-ligase) adenylyltransferase [Kineococcus radiotolerans SRS30216 = ATCC BAA-149]
MSTASGGTRGRRSSAAAQLVRAGFADPDRAARLLRDPALAGVVQPPGEPGEQGEQGPGPRPDREFTGGTGALVRALARTADPDQALLGLVRWAEALTAGLDRSSPPHEVEAVAAALDLLRSGDAPDVVGTRARLLAVLGGSVALADHLVRHPGHWTVLVAGTSPDPGELRTELLAAVGADAGDPAPVATTGRGGRTPTDALRVAYRRRLLGLAGRDLASADPLAVLPTTSTELADLAAAALEAALAIARSELPDHPPQDGPGSWRACRLAVLGMGKTGGRELNYLSDVDVVYVAEPAPGAAEDDALAVGAKLAVALQRICAEPTGEGALWEVDAALRPEGKSGSLVRTLDSHVEYYRRWAKTWEFQALLKARPVAGDTALGWDYVSAIAPMVWSASEREGFVADVQSMRRRVEALIPSKEADRQLKLGVGGLRDVEFSIQLLQMVHGRTDERLRRSANTLEALESLAAYGYVGRHDAGELDRDYRLLRSLEHRIQVHRLRRTHVLPVGEDDLRRLGRSLGLRPDPVAALDEVWRGTRRDVRRLHEKLFYRPLLTAVAKLPAADARIDAQLSPQAARERLAALGYRDPAGALRHLEALTAGVSRRASIQRTLLPVMLGWIADGADPDAGLLAFRQVSEALAGTQWFLTMLRDAGAAAERLAHVLAAARMPVELLLRSPEAVAVFADDDRLAAEDVSEVTADAEAAARRRDDVAAAVLAVRGVRRREQFRTVVADLVGVRDLAGVGQALSDADQAVLEVTLRASAREVERRSGQPLPTRLLVVGMGRLGAGETGYGSDADVLFVHDPLPGADETQAQRAATEVVAELRRLLAAPGPEPALEVDADLRPEGRNGPLVRSLSSYRAYYERWSLSWEAQALLRARPVAGDADLGEAFLELVDPLRWPAGGLPEADVREVRRIKARVEAERLPRGADPSRHLKLGRGGISDVEWTAQLLQLQHAHEHEGLRTTSTPGALRAAAAAGLLAPEDAEVLLTSWDLASRARNAVALWRGKPGDSLPTQARDLDGVARMFGFEPGSSREFEELYLRTTRRCRAVVERVFYAREP